MISRIWRGWTTHANADAYEALLRSTILPGILSRNLSGFRAIELLRRPLEGEVEFITVMWFDSMDAIIAFAGPDPEKAVVPPAAQALLSRFDAKSQHYELRKRRETGA